MTEELIISLYSSSSQNAKARAEAVNALRHLHMDLLPVDVSDDDEYMVVYQLVMSYIERTYPSLSWEVKRQMAKKKRRQVRRSLVKCEVVTHI